MSEEHEGFVLRTNGLRMWNVQREPRAYFGSVQHIQSMLPQLLRRSVIELLRNQEYIRM